MSPQLLLFTTPEPPTPSGEQTHPAAWVLDEETRAIGRRRIAEARAILRARRLTGEPVQRHPAGAQPAA